MPSLQPYGGKGWTLACLLPPSSISLYANILLKLESAQRGISRETLHLSVNSQSPFSAATVFQMLLLDILLYAVLTWYFDQVQPQTFAFDMAWCVRKKACVVCCFSHVQRQTCAVGNCAFDFQYKEVRMLWIHCSSQLLHKSMHMLVNHDDNKKKEFQLCDSHSTNLKFCQVNWQHLVITKDAESISSCVRLLPVRKAA